ncbi:MAG: recombination mediator RecR [Thermodesulfobacteriota bacterium]
MAQELPAPLRDVVERLSRLPGMGPKSALRAALELLRWPRERAEDLGRSILELRRNLCFCSRCAALSDTDPCGVCADPGRSDEQLMVVAEWDSLLAIEAGGFYRGRYLVLGGLLAPLDNVTRDQLEFGRLRARLAEGGVKELILALGATLEAEATATSVRDLAAQIAPDVAVTRLAQGIPLGAEVKYMDRETLKQSLVYRQKL